MFNFRANNLSFFAVSGKTRSNDRLYICTANNEKFLAVSGKTRAIDFSAGSSGENSEKHATAVRILFFELWCLGGEIRILSAHLPLTACGPAI